MTTHVQQRPAIAALILGAGWLMAGVLPAATSNDYFSNAWAISGDAGISNASNVGATSEAGEPKHWSAGGPYHSVWWRYTAPANGQLTIATLDSYANESTALDTTMAVYTGTLVNALSRMAWNDDSFGVWSEVSVPVVRDTVYAIAVDGYNDSNVGTIALHWNLEVDLAVAITNASFSVPMEEADCSLFVTNEAAVVGTMQWLNQRTGMSGAFPAAPLARTIGPIGLEFGANTIVVSGTNVNGKTGSASVTVTRAWPPQAFIAITNGATVVAPDVASVALGGSNNLCTVGVMTWHNSATDESGTLPVGTPWWTISTIALVEGENTITVRGSNVYGQVQHAALTVTRAIPPNRQVDLRKRVPGYMKVKLAVLNYEPLFENHGNQKYWQYYGLTDPRICVQLIVDGFRHKTDGMLDFEIAVWTNVDLFPYSQSTNALGEHRFSDASYMADASHNTPGTMDYLFCLTNDFPEVLGMVDRGEVDHVIVGGGPYFGYHETLMLGKGASWCNSSPTVWTNERTISMMGMNCERAGSCGHPIGHGHGESVMAQWFMNSGLPYMSNGGYPPVVEDYVSKFTNINEFAAFTRYQRVVDYNIGCGNIHWAPNGTNDGWGYDYFRNSPVLSTADNWNSPYYPQSLTNAPRLIQGREWDLCDESMDETGFSWWWWNHFPQQVGIYRGKLNNWMTYAWDWNTASYPLGADQRPVLTDLDLAGWFTYQIYAPPGTTQVTVQITSPSQPVQCGLRKNFIPKNNRSGSWSPTPAYRAYDDWAERTTSYTRVLTESDNYGRGLTGYWYTTFGNAFASPSARPVCTYSDVALQISILPKPTNTSVTITVTAPTASGTVANTYAPLTNIAWTIDGLPQGVRATHLYYQLTNDVSAWIPICADYNYHLRSPYPWHVPTGVLSSNARVIVMVEDVYGVKYYGYSAPFNLICQSSGGVAWEETAGVAVQNADLHWDSGQDFVHNRDTNEDGYVYVRFFTGSGGDDGTSQCFWRVRADLPITALSSQWQQVLHVRANQQKSEWLCSLKYNDTIVMNGWLPGYPGLPGYPWSIFSFWLTNSAGKRSLANGVRRDAPLCWYPDNAYPKNTCQPGGFVAWTSPQAYQLLVTDGAGSLSGDDYADGQIRRIQSGQNTTLYAVEMTTNSGAASRSTIDGGTAYFIEGPDNTTVRDGIWCATNIVANPANLRGAFPLIPYSSMAAGADGWSTPNANRPVAIHAIAPRDNYLYKHLLIVSFSAGDADQRMYAFDLAAPTNGPVTLYGAQNLWPAGHDKWLGQVGNSGRYLFMLDGAFADTRLLQRLDLGAWAAQVGVTNPTMTVDETVTTVQLFVTNNAYTVGALQWTNTWAGAGGVVPVAGLATVLADVPVAPGANTIIVTGTNVYGYLACCTARVLVVPEPIGLCAGAIIFFLARWLRKA